jgi:pimeloyl-ACP methyl ester carboxylesterase
MGTADVDWPDPLAEAHWIVERLGSELIMLEGAGHHPHVEYPRQIADAVTGFAELLGPAYPEDRTTATDIPGDP